MDAIVFDANAVDRAVVETVDVYVAMLVTVGAFVVDAVGGVRAVVETVDVDVGCKSLC